MTRILVITVLGVGGLMLLITALLLVALWV